MGVGVVVLGLGLGLGEGRGFGFGSTRAPMVKPFPNPKPWAPMLKASICASSCFAS